MRPHENYQMCSFNREKFGFDYYEAETLCDQIQKYINEQEPFDLDIGFAKDNPVNWWKYINTESEPDALPRIASYLFAICPNSATCERGFSTLGWLCHKRRLNLNNTRLSDDEINIRIAEAFAEDDDEEYNEDEIGNIPRDILDDSDENNVEDDEVDDSGNNKRPGEGDYDYDIDDVLGMDDGDNNDDNYDDNEE
ncbi:ribonuclease H-like domain-containing protein [Rhizophagus irregularis DAOM 181602=DAOM 197198]|nr:ribonuclease H-like domain-containing protein [Rhizophagus irregularis DAOM 181602=DAOM 197198]